MNRFRFVNIGKDLATIVSNLTIKLNEAPYGLIFECSSEILEPDNKQMLPDGSFSDEYLHDLLKDFMFKNKYKELPIGITNYPLNEELYSSCYRESAILSLANWNSFSTYPIQKGIKYLLADAILTFYIDYAPHEDKTYGCPSDFCDNLTDINIGMKKGEYCGKCKRLIANAVEQNQISLATVASINRLLDDVADRKVCFIIMPFDPQYNAVYKSIKNVVTSHGFTCSRDSEIASHAIIMDTIKEMIIRADLINADLTGKNPNVFYELGFCHAHEKHSILLTQNKKDVPFDVRHRRYLHYKDYNDLEVKLSNELKTV